MACSASVCSSEQAEAPIFIEVTKMAIIYEIAKGKLNDYLLDGKSEYILQDISHLIIYPITEEYLCVTNSFLNKSFLISKEDWKGKGIYPADFERFVGYPSEPLKETELPENYLELSRDDITFVIVMSYNCNLHCKYCYQQCDPTLDRNKISLDNLTNILSVIDQYYNSHPEKYINIELFGGEPLLKENHNEIIHIFDFCVEHKFPVAITTNGVNLPYYLKDLIIYSGLQMTVNTTIDSISENEKTRFSASGEEDSSGGNLLNSIYILINNDVSVSVGANIDRHNIGQIESMIQFYKENGFLDNPNFRFLIGRVDDRRFETGYDQMVTDSELLFKLAEIEIIPSRIDYAFVKASLFLCRKLDPGFRQMEMRYVSNYCWSSAPIQQVFYIDAQLDVFRCSYTVGRKQYSLFKFSLDSLENYQLPNRTYRDYEKCRKCVIGGYCSGGCALSADVNFDKMCAEEMADFDAYIKNLYYPRVKEMLHNFFSDAR